MGHAGGVRDVSVGEAGQQQQQAAEPDPVGTVPTQRIYSGIAVNLLSLCCLLVYAPVHHSQRRLVGSGGMCFLYLLLLHPTLLQDYNLPPPIGLLRCDLHTHPFR